MVVQNYPQGFIGSVSSKTQSEESSKSVEAKEYAQTKENPTSEYKQLSDEIRRLEKTLYRIQSGKTSASAKTEQMLQERLNNLNEARDNLKKIGIATYTVKVPSEATNKDVVVTPSGFQSKASFLQTPQEKEATNVYYSKLSSTSEGVKYKGDTNGSVYSGTNNRVNPYDNVASVDSTKGVSKTIPQGAVKSSVEVFGKPTLYSQILRKQSEAQEQARLNPTQAGAYNVKGYFYGAVSVPVLIATQPKEFVKGIFYSFTNPRESAQAIGTSLKNEPEFFIGQQVATYGTFKGISVGVVNNSVTNCMTLLGNSSYTLIQNITITGNNCFTINNYNTTLDCNGYNIIGNNTNLNVFIKDAKKFKNPLFTTEDGVDIFEGDKFYTIDSNFEIQSTFGGEDEVSNAWSSKEKAEEYILYNKPVLSLENVLDIWTELSGYTKESLKTQSVLINKITEFTKNKLNK